MIYRSVLSSLPKTPNTAKNGRVQGQDWEGVKKKTKFFIKKNFETCSLLLEAKIFTKWVIAQDFCTVFNLLKMPHLKATDSRMARTRWRLVVDGFRPMKEAHAFGSFRGAFNKTFTPTVNKLQSLKKGWKKKKVSKRSLCLKVKLKNCWSADVLLRSSCRVTVEK